MRKWRRRLSSQDGASAVWFSLMTAFVFMALAAVTVDVGEFFEDAAAEQRSADFACLAGAQSIADYSVPVEATRVTNGYQAAARNITSNIPEYSGLSGADVLTAAGTMQADPAHIWADPSGRFGVRMEWDDTADTFTVEIGQTVPTTFGNTLGFSDVEVDERAVCAVGEAGIGGLPFAVTPSTAGTLNAPKGDCNQNHYPGNCGQLDIPHEDGNPSDYLTYNIAFGLTRQLQVWDGTDRPCDTTPTCNIVEANPGFTQPALTRGFITSPGRTPGDVGRLRNLTGNSGEVTFTTVGGRVVNNDPYSAIATGVNPGAGTLTPVSDGLSPPMPPLTGLDVVSELSACTHPRLARVPVLRDFPNGASEPRKIVEFIYAYVEDPNAPGAPDMANGGSSDNVEHVSARPFLLAPGATCLDDDGIPRTLDPEGRFGTYDLVE